MLTRKQNIPPNSRVLNLLDVLQAVVTTIICIPHESEIYANCFSLYIKYSDKKTECQNFGPIKNNFHQSGGKIRLISELLFPVSMELRHQGYDRRRRRPMTKV